MDKKPPQPSDPTASPSAASPAPAPATASGGQAQPAATPPPTTPSPAPAAAKPGHAGPGWLVVGLSLLIAFIAAFGCLYVWQQHQQQQAQFQRSQGDIAGAIQRVDQQTEAGRALQRQLDRQSDSAEQQQRQLQAQINELQRQLAGQQKRLATLSTTDRDDWLLAEAEYLIRLANQRLLMGKEVQGALELLTAADAIARELDDSALYPVREALANDMAALRSVTRLDIEGLYLQLGALARQVGQLRLFALPELQLPTPEPAAPEGWQQRLESGLQAAWDKLSGYIQINRRDEVYQPLLAPEYEAAVRQNLRLMFEQAQMAALSAKQRLYEDSLTKATDWLRNYYRLDKDATADLVAAIEALREQQIALPMPDISSSLQALKHYLDTRRPVDLAADGDGEAAL